jgi:hypothetical protein
MSLYWILTFVPELVIHLVLVIGLIGLFVAAFVQAVPFINQYKFPIQIIALILCLTGVYFEGALGYKNSVAIEVAELKQKLAEAEAKGAKVNTEIVEKIVKDTQVIRQKGQTITEYVDREVVKHDQDCTIPKEVINAHNAAATMDISKLDGATK